MKKFLLLVVLAITTSAVINAQVPRTILFEEFSGENCGPCAATWPAVRALLDTNPRVILCKYMVAIPSAGSLCTLWPTVTTRQSYYSVTSAPFGKLDGAQIDPSKTSPDHPAYLTQAIVNSRLAIQSPISINASHTFGPSGIIVNYSIKNETPSAISGTYLLQIALVEDSLEYLLPPGTNGETEFQNVVRMMDPFNANGKAFTMPNSGISTPGTATIVVPDYVRNKSKLRVIVWVQNSATKEVVQAGISNKVTPSIFTDLTITPSFSSLSMCDTQYTPKIKLFNIGNTKIDSANIAYGEATSIQYYTYKGPLNAKDSSALITLNPVKLIKNKKNTNLFRISTVNGVDDDNLNNNESGFSLFVTDPKAYALSFSEKFQDSTVVGNQKFLNGGTSASTSAVYVVDKNVSATPLTDDLGGFGLSTKSMRYRPYNADFYGQMIPIFLNKVNLTGIGSTETVKLYFNHAYAKSSAGTIDSFIIDASGDCANSWTRVVSKSADQMKTADDLNSGSAFFYPTKAQWIADSFDLASLVGNSSVMLRISYKIGNNPTIPGNNFYIDDIEIKKTAKGTTTPVRRNIIADSVYKEFYKMDTLTKNDYLLKTKYINDGLSSGNVIVWKAKNKLLPSGWSISSICDHNNCYPYLDNMTNSFIYKNSLSPDSNILDVTIAHNKKPGYGYLYVQTYSKADSANTDKLCKFALLVSGSSSAPVKIISDSVFKAFYKSDTLSNNDYLLKTKYLATGLTQGDIVMWRAKTKSLPTGWSISSICDHNNCYPYTDNLSNSFTYKNSLSADSNILDVTIAHNKIPGYGFLNVLTYKKADSVNSSTNCKFALLLSKSVAPPPSSIIIPLGLDEKLLYYFDNTIFIDNEFNNATLNIFDITGKLISSQKVNTTTVEFNKQPRGIYMANIEKDGAILKTLKFDSSK